MAVVADHGGLKPINIIARVQVAVHQIPGSSGSRSAKIEIERRSTEIIFVLDGRIQSRSFGVFCSQSPESDNSSRQNDAQPYRCSNFKLQHTILLRDGP